MSGKEIRRAMWQRAKGRRGFLLLVSLVGFLPSLVQILALRLWHLTLPLWLGGFPAAPVGMLLSLGVCAVALKQTEGNEQKKVSHMFTFFTDGRLGKAILLALALWAVSTVFTALSTLMTGGGGVLMNQADRNMGTQAGGLLLNLLGRMLALFGNLFTIVVLFPVRYSFTLCPERTVKEHLLAGAGLGLKKFWSIFVFVFWLSLPIVLFTALLMLLYVFNTVLGPLLAAVLLAALFWYMPYFELAHAAFAKELFHPEKKAQKKEKRAMKLKEKDGWCQVGLLTGEKKKGDDS